VFLFGDVVHADHRKRSTRRLTDVALDSQKARFVTAGKFLQYPKRPALGFDLTE
jgi:hypothetical protein